MLHEPGVSLVGDNTDFQNNPSASTTSDLLGRPVRDKLDRKSTSTSDPAATSEAIDYCSDASLSEKQSGVTTQSVSNKLIASGKDRLLHKPGVSLVGDNTYIQNNPSASKTSDLLGRPVRDKLDRNSTTIAAAVIRLLQGSTRTSDKFLSGSIGWASDDLRAHIGPPELNSPIVTRGA
jgi:hypothetical protein